VHPAWRIAHAAVVVSAPPAGDRVRQRRARAAVLVAVGVFVAVQLGTHRAIDSEAVPLRDPIYAEKFGLLKRHPVFFTPTADRPRLLAVGSSRTQLALDAERLSDSRLSVFNFGCAGCGPVAGALYLRRLLDAGLTCDVALVELHPAMLADQHPPFESRWLHDYRLRRHEPDTLREYGWDIGTPPQFRPGGWLATTHIFRFAALNAHAPALLPSPFGMNLAHRTDARGHVPGVAVPPADRLKHLANAYMEYYPAFYEYRPGGPAVAAVKDTLTQLKRHGIRPTLLLTPESSEFRSWYGPGGQKVITAFAMELATEFGVPLIDAREWLPDAGFADGHHCTPAGATAFTDRLRGVLR
jgi:hypothetical protein